MEHSRDGRLQRLRRYLPAVDIVKPVTFALVTRPSSLDAFRNGPQPSRAPRIAEQRSESLTARTVLRTSPAERKVE
jgi:hypothetical protein